jgi:hypothetical protein
VQELKQQIDRTTALLEASDIAYDDTASGLSEPNVQALLDAVVSNSPAYTITGGSTQRSIDADGTPATISGTYTQAEVEALRDQVELLSDVLATLLADLKVKAIIG